MRKICTQTGNDCGFPCCDNCPYHNMKNIKEKHKRIIMKEGFKTVMMHLRDLEKDWDNYLPRSLSETLLNWAEELKIIGEDII